MVSIVPRVDPLWIGLVRDIHKSNCDLCWILPGPDVWISRTRINQLVLNDYELLVVVDEVLYIQNLGVWVIIYPSNCSVSRIGHIHYVHLAPSSDVCIGPTIRGLGNLYLCITRGCEGIE